MCENKNVTSKHDAELTKHDCASYNNSNTNNILNFNTIKSGATPGRLSWWVCIRVVILNSSGYFALTIHGHVVQAAGMQSKSHVRNALR